MRRRVRTSNTTELVYENVETGRRYNFRKVDSHTYVYTNDSGARESVGIYAIRKKKWKFIPEVSSLLRINPSV